MVGWWMVLMFENIKNAFSSIWSNKIRSILTVLGVVIGVSSVTILISLGEGLKQDVSGLIQGLGTNVIVAIGGKIDTTKSAQSPTNPANFINGDILTPNDVASLEALPDIAQVSPISLVGGSLKNGDKQATPTLFGTYPNFLDSLQVLQLNSGSMFASKNSGNEIVLGPNSKNDLFGSNSAIGQTVTLADENFNVVGTLGNAKSSSIFGSEFDSVSLIPFDTATHFNKDQVKIMRIIVHAKEGSDVNLVKQEMQNTIL